MIGLSDKPGVAFNLFNTLAKKNINVDIILQSIGRDGTKDISFTVEEDEADNTVEILGGKQAAYWHEAGDLQKRYRKDIYCGRGYDVKSRRCGQDV